LGPLLLTTRSARPGKTWQMGRPFTFVATPANPLFTMPGLAEPREPPCCRHRGGDDGKHSGFCGTLRASTGLGSEGMVVVRSHRERPWTWGLAVAGILAAAVLLLTPGAAGAGILDFLFGGFQQPQAPSPPSSYAEPPASPSRRAPDGTREDGGGG